MLDQLFETENLILIGIILCLLMCSGFFSSSETALTAASRARIHAAEQQGDKRGSIALRLLAAPERLLGGILLGNNLVNILASVLTTALFTNLFGTGGMALVLATIVMTALILIFAEVLPKTYAIGNPDGWALTVSRPISFLVKIFAPIVALVQIIVNVTLRLFGAQTDGSAWTALDEIRGAVDLHHREGGVARTARDRVIGAIELGELTVEDIMIHRKNLIMIESGIPPADVVAQVLESGHTRLPVWKDDQDNVIGILYAKDLLTEISRVDGNFNAVKIDRILREAWFVPETTGAVKQLRAFQKERGHFALVVDEYGTLMGVVTLEDIIEEIVGDIKDEYDEQIEGVQILEDLSVIVDGDVPVRDVNRACHWSLPDAEAVTVAGLVIHEAQTIPDIGRIFIFHGYRFEILTRLRNQITKIKISCVGDEAENGSGPS